MNEKEEQAEDRILHIKIDLARFCIIAFLIVSALALAYGITWAEGVKYGKLNVINNVDKYFNTTMDVMYVQIEPRTTNVYKSFEKEELI